MTPIFGPRRSSSVLVPTVVPCTIEPLRGAADRGEAVEKALRLVAAPRGHLRGRERARGGVEAEQVGERAADIDPDDHAHASRLVVAPRRLRRHVAEAHVARDARGIALRGIAEAAAAGRFQPHLLAAPDLHVGDLGDERRRLLAAVGLIDEPVERRGAAAIRAGRRILAALAEQKHFRAAVGQRLDLVDRAEPAAMFAGAAASPAAAPIA